MKRTQSGMTLIGFIIVLAVVGVFIYMGMKVIPMYSEYFAVKQALKQMSQEAGISQQDPKRIKDNFFARLYVSYADNVKPSDVKLARKEAGYVMTVDYEVRRPLIANFDIVGHFNAEQVLSRTAGDD
ncbi:DUF4845 domain-containing protein [Lysobacter auxotrophicus]|uniref:DUF4845 domain-containing protein n=1 Tax=Lysobacter auxotrophicus TaxID=2992573 RepID=A0ABN6ULR2_9GAMM|nr:DUF4845 domain-containing protein [Lysobacter auxotrophicus]BDU17225.1 DUF4845 domain-containing protein [Lysobacter auxotrophicus]